MTDPFRVLAFSSPKGGVGRTMTAANVAATYAAGVPTLGIDPTPALAIDFDVESPGIHYYDFASALSVAGASGCSYELRGKRLGTSTDVVNALRVGPPLGIVAWIAALRASEGFAEAIAPLRQRAAEGLAHAQATKALLTLLDREAAAQSLASPLSHAISLIDGGGNMRLVLFPAGEPSNAQFRSATLAFSWREFFENAGGAAVVDALIRFFAGGTTALPRTPRVLLDQDAGLSLAAVANQYIAHTRIVVSGFSFQNQQGLFSLVASALKAGSPSELRIVLSQYRGRDDDFAEGRIDLVTAPYDQVKERRERFAESERRRRSILDALREQFGLDPTRIFVTDFCPTAVHAEYFFRPDTPSRNALAMLVASIERASNPLPPAAVEPTAEIRLLGEFIGSKDTLPNGPLAAFRRFLQQRLGSSVSVAGVATDHDSLAIAIEQGSVPLAPATASAVSDGSFLRYVRGGPNAVRLADFDIVALPVYLVPLALAKGMLTRLSPIWETHPIQTEDSVRPIDEAYLVGSILGWRTYTHVPSPPGDGVLVGYPLFVEYQLITSNTHSIWSDAFAENYQKYEYRQFRGFHDAADILAAARAAAVNEVPYDRLIMTLDTRTIAHWYEWQAMLAIFGTVDADVGAPWALDQFRPRLLDDRTVEATVFYLELTTYAEKDSSTVGWDQAIKAFYNEHRVGFAVIWPDSVPTEFRSRPDLTFVYHIPPGGHLYEECWLLTIPADRRADAPSAEFLQILLTEFLSYEAQHLYQRAGGITVHRRVLQDLDQWAACDFLPELRFADQSSIVHRRAAIPGARRFAERVAASLAALREKVAKALADERAKRRVPRGQAIDYLWRDRVFTDAIAAEVRHEFQVIQDSFAILHEQ